MFQTIFLQNKNILLSAILCGVLTAAFSIAPQIDLWFAQKDKWNGVYAINDLDEPFYAAYVQSLIEGKPRRNSPISGAKDAAETPQKESYLSIQFLASYPTALIAKLFGISVSNAMILLSLLANFISAIVIFWLFYLFSNNATVSFAGTVAVLFGGALAAGQGSIIQIFFPESVHFPHSLIFMRRSVPATAFPALFLFFIFVYKTFTDESRKQARLSLILSALCFAFTIYSYFYFWTTAIAWFFALVILQAILDFENLQKHFKSLFFLLFGFVAALIPYFFLITNRSTDVDSALSLNFTREPDLWRTPEIISYLSIALIVLAVRSGWLELKNAKTVFLLSFSLVAPVVFNQQIITGRSLQPFHYEFFCANYISLFALTGTIFTILEKKLSVLEFKKILALTATAAIFTGAFDTYYGTIPVLENNIRRDELMAAAKQIKAVNQSADSNPQNVVLSFDFTQNDNFDSIDLPALASVPVLWSPHLSMFPDVGAKENLRRIFQALYYQNFDKDKLKNKLRSPNKNILLLGLFSADRTSALYTGKLNPVTEQEIDEIAEKYEQFRRDFSAQEAASPKLAFVLVRRNTKSDFSALDRWYERGEPQETGKFILYRVRLRTPQN